MILTLRERVEKIQRQVGAGITTDESRYDYPYMVSLYNTARGVALSMVWQKTHRLNPLCYQKHYPRYESNIQSDDACYVRFHTPQIINLQGQSYGDQTDGNFYVGDVSGKRAYAKVKDRTELSTMNGHRFMKVNGRYMAYLYDGALGMIEIFGNSDLEQILVNGVFMNPQECNTYNVDNDNYPIDDNTADIVEKAIFQYTTSIIAQGKPDYLSDGTDTPQMINAVKRVMR